MSRVLCYHSVDRDWRSQLSIPTETFADHVSWIIDNVQILTLGDAISRMDRSGTLPRGSTALTFDDGYTGVYEHAFPMLRRLGMTATLFAVSGALDGGVRPVEWLDERDRGGRDVAVMGPEAVRELAEAGWTIGSHSHTHRDLTQLSEHECELDLRHSREALEELLGRPVRWVAYPRGRHAQHVRRAAKRAGFTFGFSLPESHERVDPMALPRVGIYRGDGVAALRAKLSRWYLPLRTSPAYPLLRRAVRAVRRSPVPPQPVTTETSGRVEVYQEIASVAKAWDELADRTLAPPFMRPGWFECWWDAFGSGQLAVFALFRDEVLRGVVPMVLHRGILRSATNWQTPGFTFLAEDDAATSELADALYVQRARRIEVAFLDATDPTLVRAREAARLRGYRILVRTLARAPYVDTSGSWQAYEARLSAKFRSSIRRRWRRLEEAGGASIDVFSGLEGLDDLMDEAFRVEALGWKGERKTAVALDPGPARFYPRVGRWAAARGFLRLAFLRAGDRAIAFDFSLEDRGVHYGLKTGFDPAYRRFAPGMLLRHAMIERAFAEPVTTIEFLGKDDPWKLEWTKEVRERMLHQAFARGPATTLEHWAYAYGRPVARWALAAARSGRSGGRR